MYIILYIYSILSKTLSSLPRIKIASKGWDDMGFKPESLALDLALNHCVILPRVIYS